MTCCSDPGDHTEGHAVPATVYRTYFSPPQQLELLAAWFLLGIVQ